MCFFVGGGSPTKQTFSKWCNQFLQGQLAIGTEDRLEDALRDGVRLAHLVQTLSGTPPAFQAITTIRLCLLQSFVQRLS